MDDDLKRPLLVNIDKRCPRRDPGNQEMCTKCIKVYEDPSMFDGESLDSVHEVFGDERGEGCPADRYGRIVCQCNICLQALQFSSTNGRTKAHTAARLPVLSLALFAGLLPNTVKVPVFDVPVLRKVFLLFGVLFHCYLLTGNLFVWQLCHKLQQETVDKLSPSLCYGAVYNETKSKWPGILEPVIFVRFLFSFSQVLSYAMMLYTIILIRSDARRDALSFNRACEMLTLRQWLKVDFQILLYFGAWVAFEVLDTMYSTADYHPADQKTLWQTMENCVMWLYIGAPCWIFSVIIGALELQVKACYVQILRCHSNLDDVIGMYRQLCKHVFCTVTAIKYWFVVHWFAFGFTFSFDVGIGFKFVDKFKNNTSMLFWLFRVVLLLMSLYPFLYPCLRAASLTNKTENMLEKLNNIASTSWRKGHPFRNRQTINQFLVYANQAQCGFRVGRLRFNNGLAWLSIFIGISGFLLKLL